MFTETRSTLAMLALVYLLPDTRSRPDTDKILFCVPVSKNGGDYNNIDN